MGRLKQLSALGLLGLLVILAFIPIDSQVELRLAGVMLGALLILRRLPETGLTRILFLSLAGILTARYFAWRVTNTLHWHDPLSTFAMTALFLAELYAIIVLFLGFFANAFPIRRKPSPPQGPEESWPVVDVLVPSYNESLDLLEVTLIAAANMRYPREKLNVYLCDDGGTDERVHHPDPERARQARERRDSCQALCEQIGVTYLTRPRNLSSKAGNLNEAMQHTHGDLVLILDADHIPTADFLEKTVGFFQADDSVYMVQTPHFFINPDPLEKNHGIFGKLPGEYEMFHGVIQQGLDYWNAAQFCGSAAVLRRRHLDEVGGISGITITEDAETSLRLHAKGYRSIYLNETLISGLQPETFSGFVTQRIRWAQGMVQILLLRNPLLTRGLTLPQRICYLGSCFFWLFGYSRLVFLLAPAAFLILGLKIYDTTPIAYLSYAAPYVITNILVADYLFGKVRWTFVSEVYELLQALFAFPAIVKVFLNPWAPRFSVTPKGEFSDRDFVSDLSAPFYPLFGVTVLALGMGVHRWFVYPGDRMVTVITMAWELFNLIMLNAANGVLYERRQRRLNPRMPADIPAVLGDRSGRSVPCTVRDLSVGGAYLTGEVPLPEDEDDWDLRVRNVAQQADSHLPVRIQNRRRLPDGSHGWGAQFLLDSLEVKTQAITLSHGDSQRWNDYQANRQTKPGILRSFWFVLLLGSKYNGEQSRAFLLDAGQRLLSFGSRLLRTLRRSPQL